MLFSFRRTLWHRSIAVVVASALLALTIPAAPAEAAGAMLPIDPLQTATRIEALSTRVTIAADIAKNLGPGTPILDSQIVKPSLPAITFKPFPIVDPKASPGTAATIAPDAMIVTPGGKTVRAADYWNEINGIEKDLNSRGQSLRNGTKFDVGRLAGSTQSEMLATKTRHPQLPGTTLSVNGKAPEASAIIALVNHTPVSDPSPLDTGFPTIINGPSLPSLGKINPLATPSPTPKPTATPTEPPPDTLQNGIKDEHRKPLDPLPTEHDTMDFTDLSFSKSYTESEGNKGSAEFYLKADMTSSATKSGDQNVMGKVATGAYILGGGGDIASASASLVGTTARVDIEAAGSTIYQKSGELKAGGAFADSTSDSTTFLSFSIPIQVSYFVVTIAASVSGSVGVSFAMNNFNTIGGGISFSVTPYMSVGGSFSVSVGVGVADIISVSVGIQGNITLASISLPLIGGVMFTLNDFYTGKGKSPINIYACHPHFVYDLRGELQYQFLSGSVAVFLSGCFIFCATIFSITLFNWSGFTGNDTLFHTSGDVPSGDIYSDSAEYGYKSTGSIPVRYTEDNKDGVPKACADFAKRYFPFP